jgi:rSAM/selenodomain-associated transferase 2
VPDRCISIVIPTLNEAAHLGTTLDRIETQSEPFEVLVVDGQSTDDTVQRARAAGATVLNAPRGRAQQLNRGAEAATGDILLFLHADTLLPANGLSLIRRTLSAPSATAGTFQLEFDRPSPLLRLYAWCTRWPWIRICFGDRGLFVEQSVFEAVGGYPEWPLFEDLELAGRLDARGGFCFLDAAVTTSARRFERCGPVRQQARNLYLWLHYMAGTDPERVATLYKYPSAASEAEGTPSELSSTPKQTGTHPTSEKRPQ